MTGPVLTVQMVAPAVATLSDNRPDTAPGSISSSEPGGRRRVYVFGWIDGRPGLWESHGADVEDKAVRVITGLLTPVSTLAEPFELDTTSRFGLRVRLRFTLSNDSPTEKGKTA